MSLLQVLCWIYQPQANASGVTWNGVGHPSPGTGLSTFTFHPWYFSQWSLLVVQIFLVYSCKYLFTRNQNKISKWACSWSKDVIFRSYSSVFLLLDLRPKQRFRQRFLPSSVKYIIYRPAMVLRSILHYNHLATFFQKLHLHPTIN